MTHKRTQEWTCSDCGHHFWSSIHDHTMENGKIVRPRCGECRRYNTKWIAWRE